MTPNCTVVIPAADPDATWVKHAIQCFPQGTPYKIATGDYAESVNAAVKAADTKWVLVWGDDLCPDWLLDGLLSIAYDCEVVYPGVIDSEISGLDVKEVEKFPPPPFCTNRLLFDQFLPRQSLILREAFLKAGGYRAETAPMEGWDLFVRGSRAGWRFKPLLGGWLWRNTPGRTADYDRDKIRSLVVPDDPPMKATFYHQATHPCSYLRCVLPARYMPAVCQSELYSAVAVKEGVEEPQSAEDVEDVQFPFHHGDAAVLQFAGDHVWALLMHFMQEQGRKALVEVDDNYLFDPGKQVREKSNWGVNIGEAIHTYQGHRYITKVADGVIVTTDQLASGYSKVNPNVHVIPNPVDPVDWRHVKRADSDVFRIGWFASDSHKADIPLVTRAMEWASRQPGVEVVTLGIDPKWKFPYTQLPWVDDMSTYRKMCGLLDLAVCPVIPSPFSIFRSDVKYSEMTMGGAACIVSDVQPYSRVPDGEACWKAGSAKDFFHLVKHAVQNRDETRQMAAAGREWVDENRNIHKLLPLWEQALEVKAIEVPARVAA